ncbi:Ran-specific GTPase-activating protein 30 [Coemansia sp. Benny D160-2]|nr:Ran-specific GTPase-activating protein 30 [Coemansia sp. Benny D160-2]
MEDLFAKLALQTVNLVGKAAFGAASSMAMRQVAAYANRVPQSKSRQAEIDRLRTLFEAKLRIITPAIDLVDIISARGHSAMASVLQLTYALRSDIVAFSAKLEKLDQMVERALRKEKMTPGGGGSDSSSSLSAIFRRVSIGPQSAAGSEAAHSDLAALNDAIVDDLKALLVNIEEAVPLLNLALTTSGAHLGTSLPPGISPSRLMQASALLSRSSTWHDHRSRSENQAAGASSDVMVGDPFVLRLYSLFVASVRPKSKADFTWKEEFAKCRVALWRCAGRPGNDEDVDAVFAQDEYVYELRIIEDLDDGRYHDDDDDDASAAVSTQSSASALLAHKDRDSWVPIMNRKSPTSGPMRAGRVIRIPLDRVASLHYTSAGSLLNIEDSSSPVLVVSSSGSQVTSSFSLASADDSGIKSAHSEGVGADGTGKASPAEQTQQTIHWYALEVAVEDNHDQDSATSAASSDDENGEDDKESESESQSESESDEEADDQLSDSKNTGAATTAESRLVEEKDKDGSADDANAANTENPDLLQHDSSYSEVSHSDSEFLAAEEYLRPVEFLANEWSRCTLSLLEYTIRLASVEMREQLSHLEVTDEKLRLYLLGGAPGDPYAAHDAPGGALRATQDASYRTTTPAAASRMGTGFNTSIPTPNRRDAALFSASNIGSPTPKYARAKSSRSAFTLGPR